MSEKITAVAVRGMDGTLQVAKLGGGNVLLGEASRVEELTPGGLLLSGDRTDEELTVRSLAVMEEDGRVRFARLAGGEEVEEEKPSAKAIKSVTHTSMPLPAELKMEEDGRTPLTLGVEEARARYRAMAETVAKHDPSLSLTNPAAMTAWEEDRYYAFLGDDPTQGPDRERPIRRLVYQGKLLSGTQNGILATRIPVIVIAEEATSTASIYLKNAATPKTLKRSDVNGDYRGGNSTASITRPLIAVRETEDWDKVCTRVYFQVKEEDGTWTYGVLELYNARKGNCRLGRVEMGEEGSPERDPLAKELQTRVDVLYEGDVRTEQLVVERQEVNAARLKEIGSSVDREKDRFAIWVYDRDKVFDPLLPPNALVTGEWEETPAEGKGEELDPEHPAPTELTAWVSPESGQVCVLVRTEDPCARASCGVVMSGFKNYVWGEPFCTHLSRSVEDDAGNLVKIEYYIYPMLVEPDQTVAAGEVCAKVYIHVKTEDQGNVSHNETNSGRLYTLKLRKGYGQRELTGVEYGPGEWTEGMDMTSGTIDQEGRTAAIAGLAKGWHWVRLTAGTAEGDAMLHVFRPDELGVFRREPRCAMAVYAEAASGGPELSQPMKEVQGPCWVRLYSPGTYRVVVTGGNGLWDTEAMEYTLSM